MPDAGVGSLKFRCSALIKECIIKNYIRNSALIKERIVNEKENNIKQRVTLCTMWKNLIWIPRLLPTDIFVCQKWRWIDTRVCCIFGASLHDWSNLRSSVTEISHEIQLFAHFSQVFYSFYKFQHLYNFYLMRQVPLFYTRFI